MGGAEDITNMTKMMKTTCDAWNCSLVFFYIVLVVVVVVDVVLVTWPIAVGSWSMGNRFDICMMFNISHIGRFDWSIWFLVAHRVTKLWSFLWYESGWLIWTAWGLTYFRQWGFALLVLFCCAKNFWFSSEFVLKANLEIVFIIICCKCWTGLFLWRTLQCVEFGRSALNCINYHTVS